MIYKNGKRIAIDTVKTSWPITGNGFDEPIGLESSATNSYSAGDNISDEELSAGKISVTGVMPISAVAPLKVKETSGCLLFYMDSMPFARPFDASYGASAVSGDFSYSGDTLSASENVNRIGLTLNYWVTLDEPVPDMYYRTGVTVTDGSGSEVFADERYIPGVLSGGRYNAHAEFANSNGPYTLQWTCEHSASTGMAISSMGYGTEKYGKDIVTTFLTTDYSGNKIMVWNPNYDVLGDGASAYAMSDYVDLLEV